VGSAWILACKYAGVAFSVQIAQLNSGTASGIGSDGAGRVRSSSDVIGRVGSSATSPSSGSGNTGESASTGVLPSFDEHGPARPLGVDPWAANAVLRSHPLRIQVKIGQPEDKAGVAYFPVVTRASATEREFKSEHRYSEFEALHRSIETGLRHSAVQGIANVLPFWLGGWDGCEEAGRRAERSGQGPLPAS